MSTWAKVLITVAVVAVIGLIFASAWAFNKQAQACEESGGVWEVDHYRTRWTTMGKNEIPVPVQDPVYGCHR